MSSTNVRYKNTNAREKLRRRLKAEHRDCWICREFGRVATIDYSLPAGHPMSFEVDELVPVSKGGSPLDYNNVDAAHRRCNQWRGNKSVATVRQIAHSGAPQVPVEGTTSRAW